MIRVSSLAAMLALVVAGTASAQLSTLEFGRSVSQGGGGSIPDVRAGNILYQQLPVGTGEGVFADGAPGQFYDQRIADNFPHAGGPINGVCWWGGSENFLFDDLRNFSGFNVQFFANAGGIPGAPVSANMNFSVADTNPVPTGNLLIGGGIEYHQCVKFDAIDLPAGSYWLSMGGVAIAVFDDAYAWDFSA